MFCDIGHFSVLHTDAFGNGDVLTVDPYPVRRTEGTVETDYRYPSVNPVAEPGPDCRRSKTAYGRRTRQSSSRSAPRGYSPRPRHTVPSTHSASPTARRCVTSASPAETPSVTSLGQDPAGRRWRPTIPAGE